MYRTVSIHKAGEESKNHFRLGLENCLWYADGMGILVLQTEGRNEAAVHLRIVDPQIVRIAALCNGTGDAELVEKDILQSQQYLTMLGCEAYAIITTLGIAVDPSIRQEKAQQVGDLFVKVNVLAVCFILRGRISGTGDDIVTGRQFFRGFPDDLQILGQYLELLSWRTDGLASAG